MTRENPKQRIAFVSNSKIRCFGLDSMSFVAVGAGPKIGALAVEASQPVDSPTTDTTESEIRRLLNAFEGEISGVGWSCSLTNR